MFQKQRTRRNKVSFIMIAFFILLVWLFLIINQDKKDFRITKIIRDIGVSIESFLIPKVTEYNQELIEGINRELEAENQELKKMLNLNIEEYSFVHANVISRELDWYQEITIDKGEKDGIKVDMAVVSNQNLIGRVSKTGYSSSIIKLLTSNSSDMKVAVDIQTEKETIHGIIDGYLEDESLILVNNISKSNEIKVNSEVYTNGLGGIYPSGIYIGKIVDIGYDTLGLKQIAKIKTDISYDKLRYVTMIDRRKEE